jgi:hypothetical protein
MAFKAKELNIAGFTKFFSNAPSSPSSSPSSASTSASTTSSTPASTLTPSSCSSPIPPGDLRGPQGPQGGLGSATSGTGVDGKLCCPRKKSHCNITLRKLKSQFQIWHNFLLFTRIPWLMRISLLGSYKTFQKYLAYAIFGLIVSLLQFLGYFLPKKCSNEGSRPRIA